MAKMQINEALNALEDGHTIWKVAFAKRVCEALAVPFNDKLVQTFHTDNDIMGVRMHEGQEGSLGVFGLNLSEYIAGMYGVKDTTRQVMGRGTQARLYAEAVREHLAKLNKIIS